MGSPSPVYKWIHGSDAEELIMPQVLFYKLHVNELS